MSGSVEDDAEDTSVELDINVMSYNVFFHPRQGQDAAHRRRKLLDALARFEEITGEPLPDVVAFQEADETFASSPSLTAVFPHVSPLVGMNFIASLHPIKEFQSFPEQPGNMFVKIGVKDDEDDEKLINVVNVHLTSGISKRVERLREYEGLHKWIATLAIPPDQPVIVAGDFNDETDDIGDMPDFVLNYDHAKTGTFDDDYYQLGSWSSRANWLVALHLTCKYTDYKPGYTKTIDYVTFDRRFLHPEWSSELQVLHFKYPLPWLYTCVGPAEWCEDEKMQSLKGRWESSIWYVKEPMERLFEGTMDKKDDLYDDFSDHFPVIQMYRFEM